MAGFIDNSGRKRPSLPDPQSINKHSTPIKKRAVKNNPHKNRKSIQRLQSAVSANGGKRSQGVYNGRKLQDPATPQPAKSNSQRLNNKSGTKTPKRSTSRSEGRTAYKNNGSHNTPKRPTRKKTSPDKSTAKKSQSSTQSAFTKRPQSSTTKKSSSDSVSLQSTPTTQEFKKIDNFNKKKDEKKEQENKEKKNNVAKHKKDSVWEKRRKSKERKKYKEYQENKKREEQRKRLEKNENNNQPLTIKDADKQVQEKDNSVQLDHTNTSQPETVISSTKPKKKKRKVFKKFIGIWGVLLVVSACTIGSWGYYEWIQASLNKERDAAYKDGVRDTTDVPTIDNIVKMPKQDLSNLITSAPGASFPNNPVLERFTLNGWTVPGGNESYGRAEISMCYTGEGITESKNASAYLVSDNADSEHPHWSVDSVTVTGDKCSVNSNKGGK